MYTGSDNDVAADPTDQRISVSVEKINYGDDKGKYRVYFSASKSETYDDMAAALKGMAQYGAPSVVTIGKSVSFYVIDKARKVRTPAGAKRYGLPIGSPITAEAAARAKLGRGKPANSGLADRMKATERNRLAGGKPANSGLKSRTDAAKKPTAAQRVSRLNQNPPKKTGDRKFAEDSARTNPRISRDGRGPAVRAARDHDAKKNRQRKHASTTKLQADKARLQNEIKVRQQIIRSGQSDRVASHQALIARYKEEIKAIDERLGARKKK